MLYDTAPRARDRRPSISALVAACGLLVLVGAMVFDATVTRLGDDTLVSVMLAGMFLLVGGASAWLGEHGG